MLFVKSVPQHSLNAREVKVKLVFTSNMLLLNSDMSPATCNVTITSPTKNQVVEALTVGTTPVNTPDGSLYPVGMWAYFLTQAVDFPMGGCYTLEMDTTYSDGTFRRSDPIKFEVGE
jgi:hypothetical protein